MKNESCIQHHVSTSEKLLLPQPGATADDSNSNSSDRNGAEQPARGQPAHTAGKAVLNAEVRRKKRIVDPRCTE